MSETYIINFTNYMNDEYFQNFTVTADRVVFHTSDTMNLKTNL